jgi:hypothetical protein
VLLCVYVTTAAVCCTQGNEDKDSLNDTVQSLTQKLKQAETIAAEARAAEHKAKTQHKVYTYHYMYIYTCIALCV